MPWWNREIISRREVVVSAVPLAVDSDPNAYGDGRRADQARGFLDVEYITANCEIRVFRMAGPRADLLEPLDATPVVSATVAKLYRVDWPTPLEPFAKTRVLVVRTGGGVPVQANFRFIQTCRLN